MQLRQIFAQNVKRRMTPESGLGSQTAVAKRANIGQSYLSELLRCDASPTTDMISALADAFGCQPWELLTDSEETRRAALHKMILGERISDTRAAAHLPKAPVKSAAAKRRRKT